MITFTDCAHSVGAAAGRTRGGLYATVVLLASAFAVYVNTQAYPVAKEREFALRTAEACLSEGRGDGSCGPALRYAQAWQLPTEVWWSALGQRDSKGRQYGTLFAFDKDHFDVTEQLGEPTVLLDSGYPKVIRVDSGKVDVAAPSMRIPAKVQKAIQDTYGGEVDRTASSRAGLRTISIPLFGAPFDIEGLGIIAGLGLCFLLVFCLANIELQSAAIRLAYDVLKQEHDDTRSAALIEQTEKTNLRFLGGQAGLQSSTTTFLTTLVFALCPVVFFLSNAADVGRLARGDSLFSEILLMKWQADGVLWTKALLFLALVLLAWACAASWTALTKLAPEGTKPSIGGVYMAFGLVPFLLSLPCTYWLMTRARQPGAVEGSGDDIAKTMAAAAAIGIVLLFGLPLASFVRSVFVRHQTTDDSKECAGT